MPSLALKWRSDRRLQLMAITCWKKGFIQSASHIGPCVVLFPLFLLRLWKYVKTDKGPNMRSIFHGSFLLLVRISSFSLSLRYNLSHSCPQPHKQNELKSPASFIGVLRSLNLTSTCMDGMFEELSWILRSLMESGDFGNFWLIFCFHFEVPDKAYLITFSLQDEMLNFVNSFLFWLMGF